MMKLPFSFPWTVFGQSGIGMSINLSNFLSPGLWARELFSLCLAAGAGLHLLIYDARASLTGYLLGTLHSVTSSSLLTDTLHNSNVIWDRMATLMDYVQFWVTYNAYHILCFFEKITPTPPTALSSSCVLDQIPYLLQLPTTRSLSVWTFPPLAPLILFRFTNQVSQSPSCLVSRPRSSTSCKNPCKSFLIAETYTQSKATAACSLQPALVACFFQI
ncbi:hypothetical protein MA16_Dca013665 [Dendrobium catenatum]|uniref:Uncharacterized protein n=1 Tax=Dendrobium catenatum TaxID=906689 RepID=A0A2I0WPF4_9ASPA|nr:hypothetical protein MA16_Dca013665 [Dendrobium catenatum]